MAFTGTTGTTTATTTGVGALGLYSAGIQFNASQATPLINQAAPITDTATTSLTIQAQSAYSLATSNITGGNLAISSGAGAAKGTATASEAAGILELQADGYTMMSFDGYGMSVAMSGGISTASATLTLSAANMLCPYLVLTGTTATPSCTITIPSVPVSGFARKWYVDINAVTLSTNSIIFVCGTSAATVTITAATVTPTGATVFCIMQPNANSLYLVGA